jgi:hypothetical protein
VSGAVRLAANVICRPAAVGQAISFVACQAADDEKRSSAPPPGRNLIARRRISTFDLKAGLLFLIATLAADAQIYPPVGYPGGYPPGGSPGQYPPGGYPGQYPGGPGIPIPVPHRKGKSKDSKDSKDSKSNEPLPNFRGRLKLMDAKVITLELDDHRFLDFKRTDKTKFFKNGDELKTPSFKAGDQISVEGSEDQTGEFTAVNVYWERAASAVAKDENGDGAVQDTWKDVPSAGPQQSAGSAPKQSADSASPPAKPDPSDPGPPVLRRGKPESESREKAAPLPPGATPNAPYSPDPEIFREPPQPTAPSTPIQTADSGKPVSDPSILRNPGEVQIQQQGDPLIRKATESSMDFIESLPDYICQELMARYQSETSPANWQPIDVVTTNLVYVRGKEDYKDVAINGKPTKKKLEEIGGAWSTGEFGTILVDLFSPATAADFTYRHISRIAGVDAKEYDFTVKRENSHWTIHEGGQTYQPAYTGTVWIDPSTGRVLRIEMQAHGFPDEFPTDHVESAVDYEYVRLGDLNQYLLPVHAATLACQRGTVLCSRNTIDFRNYRKYTGESTIQYTDVNSKIDYDKKAKPAADDKTKK